MKEIYSYIKTIHNLNKKSYAIAYLGYLQGHRTEPERGSLSYMAAQAVRFELNLLFKNHLERVELRDMPYREYTTENK